MVGTIATGGGKTLIYFDLTLLSSKVELALKISSVNGSFARPSESETSPDHFPTKAQPTPLLLLPLRNRFSLTISLCLSHR